MSNKWFIIEGNIGSGKTTLIEKLGNTDIEMIKEPVDYWLSIKGSDNKNLLQQFYEDPNRYAYLFQSMVFKTRLESLDKPQTSPLRFSERSIWTDRHVFGKSCINSNKMNQLEVNCYHFWFNWLEDKFFTKPNGIIYLRCTPEKCLERMNSRGRSEESKVPIEYLRELHEYHDLWLNNWTATPVLIIDNDKDDNWDDVFYQVNTFVNNS